MSEGPSLQAGRGRRRARTDIQRSFRGFQPGSRDGHGDRPGLPGGENDDRASFQGGYRLWKDASRSCWKHIELMHKRVLSDQRPIRERNSTP